MATRAHSGTLPDSVADEGRGAAKPAWAPLLLGSVLIVALAMLASEWLLDRIGLGTDPVHSVVFMFRGALLSTLLAIWTGYYVLQMRRRVEGAHAEIAERRHELEVVAMRAEQAAGLGASARILANELRGPLNAVAIQTEILKRKTTEGTDEMIDESLRVLTEQTSRMKRLIDDYIAYARAADVVLSPATVRLESVMLRAVHASAALRESGVLALGSLGRIPLGLLADRLGGLTCTGVSESRWRKIGIIAETDPKAAKQTKNPPVAIVS